MSDAVMPGADKADEMDKHDEMDNLDSIYGMEAGNGLVLKNTDQGLTLTDGRLELRADFETKLPRAERLMHETLIKAVRIKNLNRELKVIDATAGLGDDSFILAAAGFKVRMYEYNPVIACLLEDALNRAKQHPKLSQIVSNMELCKEDSITALGSLSEHADVILLDPMFPERTKSALVKKKFQLLQKLEMPCGNEEKLLNAAIEAGPRKIVIKRPAKGQYLAGIKPSYSIEGKAIRYDCLVYPENNL